jgi:hypothetical protein
MSLQLENVDTRSELLERLRATRHVLLGDKDDSTREFFIARTPSCVIGIFSQGHGPKPSGFIDEVRGIAWVGFNLKVASVDLRLCHINFTQQMGSVFFEFLCQLQDGSIIAIHELGATRIGCGGEIIWAQFTDVVTAFSTDGEEVLLRTHIGNIRVHKETGARLVS